MMLAPFDWLPPTVALVAISIVTGAAMLGVVKVTTRQEPLQRARDHVASALYELRLFLDSPRRVFSALGRLLGATGMYTVYLLPALLAMSIPLGLMYLHMETRYGLEPLPTGTPIVVRVDVSDDVDGSQVAIEMPDGVAVTAPILVDAARHTVYARIEITEPASHSITITTPGGSETKTLVADPDATRVAPERASGLANWWAYSHEPTLATDAGITHISVPHPATHRKWLRMPWWLFWLLLATVAALALRRPLGVVI